MRRPAERYLPVGDRDVRVVVLRLRELCDPVDERDRLRERGKLHGFLERAASFNPIGHELHITIDYYAKSGAAMSETTYLIVGGGMTAAAAVQGIREHDADGSIT